MTSQIHKPSGLSFRQAARKLRRGLSPLLKFALLVAMLQPATTRGVASAQDMGSALAGLQALTEGQKLVEKGTPESIRLGIEKYKEAQAILHKGNLPEGEVATLIGIGQGYSLLEENQTALDYFNRALPIARRLKSPVMLASTLLTVGMSYTALNQNRKAIPFYDEAMSVLRAGGGDDDDSMRRIKGAALTGLGLNSFMVGEPQKGIDYLNQSLALSRSLNDAAGEAQMLNAIGAIYLRVGNGREALLHLERALQIRRSLKDKNGELQTLSGIGHVYDNTGEPRKALDYFNQSLALSREVKDQRAESRSLKEIADAYTSMGELQKAIEYFNQSLQLRNDSGTLNNVGMVYGMTGDFQKSIDTFNQALLLERAGNERRGEASTLANIGNFYLGFGEERLALDYFNQALPILRTVIDPSGEASVLNNIGGVHQNLGETQKSLDYFNQALQIRRSTGDRAGEAISLINIGNTHRTLGDKQKALEYFNQALPIARAAEDKLLIGGALNNLGEIYSAQGEWRKALDFYRQALEQVRAAGDRQKESATLGNMASAERSLGNLAEARANVEAALKIIDSLRTKIASQELRTSYFAGAQGAYEFYIDLLMRLHKLHPSEGHDVAALQASERARARSLLETLMEAGADIRQGVDARLLERERALQQQLNAKALSQQRLRKIPHTQEQTDALNREIAALLTEMQQADAQIRQSSPRYATLTQPQPLTLREIQADLLDEDTLLLEYALGDEKSYLWAVTKNSFNSYELPKRAEIEEAVRQFHDSLNDSAQWRATSSVAQAREDDATPLAAPEPVSRLSRILLDPVAAQLGTKRLLVVGEGALQFIPFAALSVPSTPAGTQTYQPLITEHEIANLTSTSTLAVLRREMQGRAPSPKTLAVLADPIFEADDARIKNLKPDTARAESASSSRPDKLRGVPFVLEKTARESGLRDTDIGLKRLPGTRQEAEQILSLVPPAERRVALDFAASRETAMRPEMGEYRYLHFATHGFLNSLHPELSGIVLTLFDEQGNPLDGYLRLHDVFKMRLAADVVVLSACQTGLGKNVRGEGLVGLTRGFMYAGAPRVVVSLWSVSDVATAELMGHFYRGMIVDKLRPAKALQAAQISLLKEKRFRHPFYWAGFTLQGEWR